jgi:hypothetical protein
MSFTEPGSSNGYVSPEALEDAFGGTAAGPLELARNRPEVMVGAAFAGGLALAIFIKRLVR